MRLEAAGGVIGSLDHDTSAPTAALALSASACGRRAARRCAPRHTNTRLCARFIEIDNRAP